MNFRHDNNESFSRTLIVYIKYKLSQRSLHLHNGDGGGGGYSGGNDCSRGGDITASSIACDASQEVIL